MNSHENIVEDENQDFQVPDFLGDDIGIFSNFTFLNDAQSGPLDDQGENWVHPPLAGSNGQDFRQANVSQITGQMIGHEASFPALVPGSSAPSTRQSPAVPNMASDQVTTTTNDGLTGQPSLQAPIITAKIGARFTRDSVRVMRNWFLAHNSHPFPNEDDKNILQQQTGLTRSQIMTWFANARRRSSMLRSRNASPSPTQTRNIPQRPGTPAPRNTSPSMNPLERWVESPPENEPASVTAIARAVASSPPDSTSDSSYTGAQIRSTDSSISSRDSHSSADSNASQSSLGSFDPLRNTRSRRRRRGHGKGNKRTLLLKLPKKYQCTFCTESFNRKYDWQRHENSVHLPLERWICCPDGPRMHNPTNHHLLSCVFCGLAEPDDAHVENHYYSACKNRTLAERSFNRKDHLRQHLRLFHKNSGFIDWSMALWRVAVPDIRSRCGICGHWMANWEARVHHISEHFKMGKSMADWQGDWGFDPSVSEIIENAIPPYLIEFERHTPYPFEGGKTLAAAPRSAYELLKLELAYFMQRFYDDNARMPAADDMQFEACRIILASESLAQEPQQPVSWLRDLILSDQQILEKARFSPIRTATESRLYPLQIKEQSTLFEACPFEKQLHDFVQVQKLLDLSSLISDHDLRQESCGIIGRTEEVSTTPSDFIATWLIRLIHSADGWLLTFRQRANIPRVGGNENTGMTNFEGTIHEYTRLERGMAEYLESQRAMGIEPSDDDLKHQARTVVGQGDNGWTQTAADNELWLNSFRRRHLPSTSGTIPPSAPPETLTSYASSSHMASASMLDVDLGRSHHALPLSEDHEILLNSRSLVTRSTHFAANDWNYYMWLEDELRRWAVATMSPHNPTQHTPTDKEFQHYARMATYNE